LVSPRPSNHAHASFQALAAHCGPRTTLLLAHQKRSERTDRLLFDLLAMHFTMQAVPPTEYHTDFSTSNIRIFQGTKLPVKVL